MTSHKTREEDKRIGIGKSIKHKSIELGRELSLELYLPSVFDKP